ncbi:DUF3558 family protein [Thermostaphylospora chromogena]|uniref:DUF3558 family protein n=1 Tax=Thermostaphylospora chromogena TaxID=35622 RepID=UPI0013F609DA|nr:DUF3558 family protein [Thermostaphylospora chromogena]
MIDMHAAHATARRTGRRASRFLCTAATVAALALATACGQTEDEPTERTTYAQPSAAESSAEPAPSESEAASGGIALEDGCEGLTDEEVERILGAGVRAEPGKKALKMACTYTKGGDRVAEVVWAKIPTTIIGNDPQEALKVATAGRSSEPVEGLGKAAAYSTDDVLSDELYVIVDNGGDMYQATITGSGKDDGNTKDLLIEMGKAIAAKF